MKNNVKSTTIPYVIVNNFTSDNCVQITYLHTSGDMITYIKCFLRVHISGPIIKSSFRYG